MTFTCCKPSNYIYIYYIISCLLVYWLTRLLAYSSARLLVCSSARLRAPTRHALDILSL